MDKEKARADQASVYILLIARCLYLCQHHLPKKLTLTVGLLENNSLTVHTLSVRSARETREKEADGCLLQLPEPDPEPDPEAKIRRMGYEIEEIGDYVRRLTEHPDRNRYSNRFVCTSFDNKPYLVCD